MFQIQKESLGIMDILFYLGIKFKAFLILTSIYEIFYRPSKKIKRTNAKNEIFSKNGKSETYR